jgi:UDP-N-acetylmuramoyl-L-alanyl-D-glutamate--2,6-diaminopimelate ligase
VAVPGLKRNGHDFIGEAVKKGAESIVYQTDIAPVEGVASVRVQDSRLAMGMLGRNFYRNPSGAICLIGITGTNGKTTVTYLLESILDEAGYNTGVIGTINYRYGGRVFQSPNTTPESIDLQKTLREMVDCGVTHVVMEVSSHAIDLKRVDACEYTMGIFTNLSSEHLDYHGTIDNYFLVKKRFFQELVKGKKIINGDDPWGVKMIENKGPGTIIFGMENPCDVSAFDCTLSMDGIITKIRASGREFELTSPLIGRFNVLNILAAVAAALALDISVENIAAGIEKVKNIPGRLERVSNFADPSIFVDYAHTHDALEKVLENLSEFKKGRIITVFGCGGDRDQTKRAPMGSVAAKLSDIAIITSDNPRTEDPLEIIDQIEKGIDRGSLKKFSSGDVHGNQQEKGYAIIPDRRKAIERAISIADAADIVLIAGKGHEDYQILGTGRIDFDDRIVAREILAGLRVGERN